MKKFMVFAVVLMFSLPLIEGKEGEKETTTFGEFKEYVKNYPGGLFLVERLERYGISDGSEVIIKFLAGIITTGNGYAFPSGYRFSFFSFLPVVWHYTNGSTEFYTLNGIETYEGSQIGGALIYPIGLFNAPRLFQQPGNIVGAGFALVAVVFPA